MCKTDQARQSISRHRLLLAVCIVVVVLLGLASRKYSLFPPGLGKYPGDALWSLMVYFGWALFKPSASSCRIAILTLVTSYLIEFSQLIQMPWLNMIRHTTLGYLVLGTVFSWYDLVAYTIGIGVAVYLDRSIVAK